MLEFQQETKLMIWKLIWMFRKKQAKALSDDEFLQAHWIIYFGYSRTKKIIIVTSY